MYSSRLALCGLLLSSPLAGLAQNTDPVSVPRFYIGLSAYNSFYQKLTFGGYRATRIPVQLTAGYQLRPRLAVQVGLAYSGISDSYTNQAIRYDDTGAMPVKYYDARGTNIQRNMSVSVLTRYTLTRKLDHRLQFDLLGGLTLEHGSFRNHGTVTETDRSMPGTSVTAPYDYRSAANSLLLSLGPSIRYRVSQRFDVLYDFTFNKSLTSSKSDYSTGVDIKTASALGLRYRFGHR